MSPFPVPISPTLFIWDRQKPPYRLCSAYLMMKTNHQWWGNAQSEFWREPWAICRRGRLNRRRNWCVRCEGEKPGAFWEQALLRLESKLKGSGRLRKVGFSLYAHPWGSFSQRSLWWCSTDSTLASWRRQAEEPVFMEARSVEEMALYFNSIPTLPVEK